LEQAEVIPPELLVEAPPLPPSDGPVDSNPEVRATDDRAARTGPTTVYKYPAGRPYQKFRAERALGTDLLLKPSNAWSLANLIMRIVDHEGPVHRALVIDRLKETCGLYSIHKESTTWNNIERAIHLAVSAGKVRQPRCDGFLLPVGANFRGYRTPGDGVERGIDTIAPEEIECAVLHLVEQQFGAHREKIPQAVARLLGISRLGSEGWTAISGVVDGLVERGALRASGLQVYLDGREER